MPNNASMLLNLVRSAAAGASVPNVPGVSKFGSALGTTMDTYQKLQDAEYKRQLEQQQAAADEAYNQARIAAENARAQYWRWQAQEKPQEKSEVDTWEEKLQFWNRVDPEHATERFANSIGAEIPTQEDNTPTETDRVNMVTNLARAGVIPMQVAPPTKITDGPMGPIYGGGGPLVKTGHIPLNVPMLGQHWQQIDPEYQAQQEFERQKELNQSKSQDSGPPTPSVTQQRYNDEKRIKGLAYDFMSGAGFDQKKAREAVDADTTLSSADKRVVKEEIGVPDDNTLDVTLGSPFMGGGRGVPPPTGGGTAPQRYYDPATGQLVTR